MANNKEQTQLSELYEQIERNNFITWLKYASPREIADASRNNRKKLRYLIDKYGGEIGRSKQLTIGSRHKEELIK